MTSPTFVEKKKYHPTNAGAMVYFECFSTVEDLAFSLNPSDETTDTYCKRLGRTLVEGNLQPTPCAHFHYNYQFYVNTVWQDRSKEVAVLRTERLWEDVARMEELLGGNPTRFLDGRAQKKHTHGSESFNITSGVSQTGAKFLCCGLRKELQVYHDLILSAVNLKADEKVETRQQTLHRCGIDDELSPEEVAGWSWRIWHKERCAKV